MKRDSHYWIQLWQRSKNFRVENDRIKPKSFLFSSFPKTNLIGFQDGAIRNILIGDFFSRYQRMAGYNVLFPVGYDSLGLTSYLENKKRSGALNEDISLVFSEQMLELGIGMDDQKTIDMKQEEFVSLLQLAFIDLYEKKYIQYGLVEVCQDKSGKKIMDSYFYQKGLYLNKVKAFYLDLTKIRDEVLDKISELPIEKELKDTLTSMFEPQFSLTLTLSVTNGKKLNYTFYEPEYIGGISFILLHPDYIDFAEYTQYEEYGAIELYLSDENTNDFGVFTGNYAINPLTGKKIPIFVSIQHECPIYIANPYRNSEDRMVAQEEGLPIIDVVQNGVFIESDFLNGIPVEEGRQLIMNQFVTAEIGSLHSYYSKDKILLSSLDSLGALLPFFIDSEDKIYSLKKHLPFLLSAKFRPILEDDIEVPGNMITGSINHIFSTGMLPLLSVLYDSIGGSLSIFSKEAIHSFKAWKGMDVMSISETEVFELVFFPLCIWTIIEKEKQVKLPVLFKKLWLLSPIYDENYQMISKANNNLLDFDDILKKYTGDPIRLYFLSKSLLKDFIFDEAELMSMKNLKKSMEEYYQKPFSSTDNLKEVFSAFLNSMQKHLDKREVSSYVDELIQFFKNHLWNNDITEEQGLNYLKLLYPLCPFLAEELYQNIFHGKYLISDDGWII